MAFGADLSTLQQLEMHSKFPVQGLGAVTDDIKATAFHGTLWSERADDHVPSVPNGTSDLADISTRSKPQSTARRCELRLRIQPPSKPFTNS